MLLGALDSNWLAPVGPAIEAFERDVAELLGVRRAVALSSGTAALHLAMRVLGVQEGDTVLLPSFTFVATANAVTYQGASPVFVDSDPTTWTIDPDLVADELSRSARRGRLPKAVVAVDIYGQCADYDALHRVCADYAVPLVEDAAEALGSTYRGCPAGGLGEAGVLSFNGNKIISTSGGGMFVTNDDSLADEVRYLATQARDDVPHYEHRVIGYNYRLSNLLAAFGRGQLLSLEERVKRRRDNYFFYQEALGALPGIALMPHADYGEPNCWLSCILIDREEFGVGPSEVRQHLDRQDIESRPVWKPMHLQPVYLGAIMLGGDVCLELYRRGLCLPSGSNLTEGDRERVVSVLRSVPGRKR